MAKEYAVELITSDGGDAALVPDTSNARSKGERWLKRAGIWLKLLQLSCMQTGSAIVRLLADEMLFLMLFMERDETPGFLTIQ